MSIEALFIIAIVLLFLELVVTSMGVLGFLAFIAYVYGLIIMYQAGMADFYGFSFPAFVAIGVSIFALFAAGGYVTYKSFRKKISVGVESMIGQAAKVTAWKNGKGKVEYEGENWRATSEDSLNEGDTCIITDYNKMTLTVKKGDQP